MLILIVLGFLVFLIDPAFAQKDTLKIGEQLKGTIIRKSEGKQIQPKPAQKSGDPIKAGEVLEIETRRGVTKTKTEAKDESFKKE